MYIKKIINKYTTNISNNIVNENIDNYIELAKSALVTDNDQRTLKYRKNDLKICVKYFRDWLTQKSRTCN